MKAIEDIQKTVRYLEKEIDSQLNKILNLEAQRDELKIKVEEKSELLTDYKNLLQKWEEIQ